jgi:hypothetical protein
VVGIGSRLRRPARPISDNPVRQVAHS